MAMLFLDPNERNEKDNYKLLTGSIVPRPIAFVTTLSAEGVLNAAPFSYFNIVASDPPLLSVSVQRSGGKQKDTARNAIDRGEFVIHVSDESYLSQLNASAAPFAPEVSEVESAGLTPVPSVRIGVPGVGEAKIRMECVLEHALPLGGREGAPACDLLIGRVVAYHIDESLYADGKIDVAALAPVSRLAGAMYSRLGETFVLERPK